MKEWFKQLNILYLALLAGQLVFCLVVAYLSAGEGSLEKRTFAPGQDSIFRLLVPLVVIGAAGGAYFINRQRVAEGLMLPGLKVKADHYRQTVIIRSAVVEGANLFSIVIALVENNLFYLIFFLLGLFVFLYFRPSPERFIQEYQLPPSEEQELRTSLK